MNTLATFSDTVSQSLTEVKTRVQNTFDVLLNGDPVDTMRRQFQQRERALKAIARNAEAETEAAHFVVARQGENLAAAYLESLGYQVRKTGHSDHFDLMVEGILRVEVKASLYHKQGNRGRYQANIRRKQRPDLVIFVPINDQGATFFIIPGSVFHSRQSITIRCFNPEFYTGQYADYRGAWNLIAEALETVRSERPQQASLEGVE